MGRIANGGRIGFDVCYKGSLLGLSLKNKKSRIGFGSIPTEKYVRCAHVPSITWPPNYRGGEKGH